MDAGAVIGHMKARYQVLLIEDNPLDAAPIRVFLRNGEFAMEHATTLTAGLQAYRERRHDVVLLDRTLPDSEGYETLKTMRAQCADVPIVMLTSTDGTEVGIEAVTMGAQDFLPKGQFDAIGLRRSLRYAIERHAVSRELADQAMLLDMASDAILVTDLKHCIQYWNGRAELLYGWNAVEVKKSRTTDLFEPDSTLLTDATNAVILNGEWSGDFEHRTRDGVDIIVQSRRTLVRNSDGQARAILIINTDITEQRAIEKTVESSQRLETVGALAAGVAHDFNNVLSPIMMGIQILQSTCTDPVQKDMLEKMKASAGRDARSVKDLLSFSKAKDGEPSLIASSEVVRKVARLCEGAFPRAVEVVCEPADGSRPVLADASQLEHALMNLCLNCRDAMPEGGTITMRSEVIEVSAGYEPTQLTAHAGTYSVFEISDTGGGISEANLAKVFQPYFTTKPPGKGSGNGLNAVLAVVKRAEGFIDMVSSPGAGTTVKVCLPVAEIPVESTPPPKKVPVPAAAVAWD